MTSDAEPFRAGTTELVDVHEEMPGTDDVLAEVLSGLRRPQKRLPCKLFYDERGSKLFDEICEQPEYYPTRTEIGILRARAHEIAEVLGTDCRLVEFGAGSSVKIRILLDAMTSLAYYMPLDISGEHLVRAAQSIAQDYPQIDVWPVVADYTRPMTLPEPEKPVRSTQAFFPGSTIGNFERARARDFLRLIAEVVRPDGGLVVGVDLDKDSATLEAAYNDAAGVTAAFNLNILNVVNDLLGASFDVDAFEHRAVYDGNERRIEMRLVAQRDHVVELDGHAIPFKKGEHILTEYSHKFRLDDFAALADEAAFEIDQYWCDANRLFAVCHLRVRPAR